MRTATNARPRRAARKRVALRRGRARKAGAAKSTPRMPEVAGGHAGRERDGPAVGERDGDPAAAAGTARTHRRPGSAGPAGPGPGSTGIGGRGRPVRVAVAAAARVHAGAARRRRARPARGTAPPLARIVFAPVSRSTWMTAPPAALAVGHDEVAVAARCRSRADRRAARPPRAPTSRPSSGSRARPGGRPPRTASRPARRRRRAGRSSGAPAATVVIAPVPGSMRRSATPSVTSSFPAWSMARPVAFSRSATWVRAPVARSSRSTSSRSRSET